MADFKSWISNYIIEPIRTGLFNSRTQFCSQSLSEVSSDPLPIQVSEDPLYNLIKDSAKFIYLNFGVKFHCLGVTKTNLLQHHRVYAIEQQEADVVSNISPGHSQLSKFLLFFMHPFQIISEESKLSFPSLSRSFPDSERDRNAFMMSVCGSKFTHMGRLCFAPNIAPITNIEIGLKADDLEVGEIAEEYFAKSVPSTSSQDCLMKFSNKDSESVKPRENVTDRAHKSVKLESVNVTLDDSLIRRDRQRKQSRKRKNRRRKQNRRIREESSSSKGSSDSSNQNSDSESDSDFAKNNRDDMVYEEDSMEVDEDCDDLVIFVDENDCSVEDRPNSIASQLFVFGFEDMSQSEDEDEDDNVYANHEDEDLETMFSREGLSLSNLVSRNSRSSNDAAASTASEAINISNVPPSPSYIISPSPDLSSFLTEDDIRRNNLMIMNDAVAAEITNKANEDWEQIYKENCSVCEQIINNEDVEVINCPAKRSLVKFSEEPQVILFDIPDEEKEFLKQIESEIEEFSKKESPFYRDGMSFDDEDE